MTKPLSKTTDLIAAALVASNAVRKQPSDSLKTCLGDCTDCPFSLPAFGLALRQAEKRGPRPKKA